MMIRTTLCVLAATMSIALTAAPASAQPAERYHARISYADLDIGNQTGADALLDRFNRASRAACGQRMGKRSLGENTRLRACRTDFVEEAVIEARSAMVAQRYRARGGRTPTVTIATT